MGIDLDSVPPLVDAGPIDGFHPFPRLRGGDWRASPVLHRPQCRTFVQAGKQMPLALLGQGTVVDGRGDARHRLVMAFRPQGPGVFQRPLAGHRHNLARTTPPRLGGLVLVEGNQMGVGVARLVVMQGTNPRGLPPCQPFGESADNPAMVFRRALAGQSKNETLRHPTILAGHRFAGPGKAPQRRTVVFRQVVPFAKNVRPVATDISQPGKGLTRFRDADSAVAERIEGHSSPHPSAFWVARENHRFSLKCALNNMFTFCSITADLLPIAGDI